MATQWYYMIDDEKYGPVSSQQLKKLANSERLSPYDKVRRTTDQKWVFASKVHGLFANQSDSDEEETDEYDTPQDDIPMGRAVDPAEYMDEDDEEPAPRSRKRSKSGDFDMFASDSSSSSDGVSFDFGNSSSSSSRGGSYRAYGKSKSSGKAAKTTAKAKTRKPDPDENLDPEEKAKRISKKERDRKRFTIITSVVAGVIVLALVVYFVMKSKPEKVELKNAKEIAAAGAAKEEAAKAASAAAENAEGAAGATEGTEGADAAQTTDGGMFTADKPANTPANASSDASGDSSGDAGLFLPKPGEAKNGEVTNPEFAPGKGNYTDASANEIKRGAVQVRVVETIPDTLSSYVGLAQETEEKLLFVKVKITNKSDDNKNLEYPGWGTKKLYKGVSIRDNFGNTYKLKTKLGAKIPDRILGTKQITDDTFDILVFDAPRKNTEFLLLDLPAFMPDETEPYKFKIPASMLSGKASAPAEEAPAEAAKDADAKDGDAKDADAKDADAKAADAKDGDKKAAPNEEGETIDLGEDGDEKAETPKSAAPVTESKDGEAKADDAKPADDAKADDAKADDAKADDAKATDDDAAADGDAKDETIVTTDKNKSAPAEEEFAEDPEAKANRGGDVKEAKEAQPDMSKITADMFTTKQIGELRKNKIAKKNRKELEILDGDALLKYMKKNGIDIPTVEAPADGDQPAEAGGKQRQKSEAELEEEEAREAAEADLAELKEDGDGGGNGDIQEAGAMRELSKQADRENDAAAREAMKGGRKNRR